jgi:DNA-binding IclR family transcriptional regulator
MNVSEIRAGDGDLPAHDGDGKNVQSIDRAFDIIETLSTEPKGLGVTELAKRLDLHKSTTHRLLATLVQRGYVSRQENGVYQFGLKAIELASYYINSLELQTEARPYIAQITTELGLTAHLGVLEGDQVVYIERMDVLSGIKLYSQIGLRMHSYCSSLGKCLLSAFDARTLAKVMANCSFNKFTPHTIGSLDELIVELKRTRRRGWAIDNLEYSLNNRCIGAPIYDYRGEIVAAISASGPPTVLTEERIDEVAGYVRAKALAISHSLGYVE